MVLLNLEIQSPEFTTADSVDIENKLNLVLLPRDSLILILKSVRCSGGCNELLADCGYQVDPWHAGTGSQLSANANPKSAQKGGKSAMAFANFHLKCKICGHQMSLLFKPKSYASVDAESKEGRNPHLEKLISRIGAVKDSKALMNCLSYFSPILVPINAPSGLMEWHNFCQVECRGMEVAEWIPDSDDLVGKSGCWNYEGIEEGSSDDSADTGHHRGDRGTGFDLLVFQSQIQDELESDSKKKTKSDSFIIEEINSLLESCVSKSWFSNPRLPLKDGGNNEEFYEWSETHNCAIGLGCIKTRVSKA